MMEKTVTKKIFIIFHILLIFMIVANGLLLGYWAYNSNNNILTNENNSLENIKVEIKDETKNEVEINVEIKDNVKSEASKEYQSILKNIYSHDIKVYERMTPRKYIIKKMMQKNHMTQKQAENKFDSVFSERIRYDVYDDLVKEFGNKILITGIIKNEEIVSPENDVFLACKELGMEADCAYEVSVDYIVNNDAENGINDVSPILVKCGNEWFAFDEDWWLEDEWNK